MRFFLSWGLVLQVLCIIHFVRRRPDTFWLFVILIGGALGSAIYIVVEVLPDLATLRASVHRYSRKRRITALEALVALNPAVGNREELADLLLEEGHYARARAIYDEIITPRTDEIDPFYRRGLCAMAMNDPGAAIPDLERVVAHDPKYDIHLAMGRLAEAYAQTGRRERADACFRDATTRSTDSQTMYNYAAFLMAEGREAEGRAWAMKVLDKQPTLPRYLRRRERPWSKRAKTLLSTSRAPT